MIPRHAQDENQNRDESRKASVQARVHGPEDSRKRRFFQDKNLAQDFTDQWSDTRWKTDCYLGNLLESEVKADCRDWRATGLEVTASN